MERSVGSLNGKWALAFKFFLMTYPIALTWAAWVSTTLISQGERIAKIEAIIASHTW